jgi:hypothetical protein
LQIVRYQVWPLTHPKGPILLGGDNQGKEYEHQDETWRNLPRHPDEDQVQLDVDRAFVYYPKSMFGFAWNFHRADLAQMYPSIPLRRRSPSYLT